jgi:hypothetical protein
MTTAPPIRAIKGFDANMQCRGFQFEVGKTYTHDGGVKACKSGFHAIEGHPLEVLSYYPPAGSRFAVVELSGALERHSDDSKVAAEILTVTREIGLSDLATEAVKWVMDRATGEGPVATGENGLATASGYQGAATASGTRGAATASGTRGAATASGDQGAATASGTQGAATASGTRGAAMACGYMGRAKGADGNALFLVERARWDGPIVSVCAVIVGQDGIAADTWYRCEGGKAVLA